MHFYNANSYKLVLFILQESNPCIVLGFLGNGLVAVGLQGWRL